MQFGVSAAIATPFTENGAVCTERLVEHARRVLSRGADGLTLFGTTGEGASLGPRDRLRAMTALLATGKTRENLTIGICATSVEETLSQVQAASNLGLTRFLLTPPYYFKGVHDDGLFDWFAECLTNMPNEARVIVYHIPGVTEIPIGLSLLQRLKDRFPKQVVAVKDSAGVWLKTLALLRNSGVSVLVGDERQLAIAAKHGGAGTICGLANLFPQRLKQVFETARHDSELDALVNTVVTVPVIPIIKAMIGEATGDTCWRRMRPPLRASTQKDVDKVMEVLQPMLINAGP